MITPEEIARLRELAARMPLPLDVHKDAGQYKAISISEFSPNGGRWIVGDIMEKYADDIVASCNALPALLDEIERLSADLAAALKRAEAAEVLQSRAVCEVTATWGGIPVSMSPHLPPRTIIVSKDLWDKVHSGGAK